jgi:hypothetical protein
VYSIACGYVFYYETPIKDGAFDSIRNLVVLETQAEHFLKVLEKGSVSTTIYLRRVPISPSI